MRSNHAQEEALFEEMRQVAASVQPTLVIFTMDGSIGQAAHDQAKAFKDSVEVSLACIHMNITFGFGWLRCSELPWNMSHKSKSSCEDSVEVCSTGGHTSVGNTNFCDLWSACMHGHPKYHLSLHSVGFQWFWPWPALGCQAGWTDALGLSTYRHLATDLAIHVEHCMAHLGPLCPQTTTPPEHPVIS